MWRISSGVVLIVEAVIPAEICYEPKKKNTSGFQTLDDPAPHSSQQVNPVNPPTPDVDVVTI